jgi:hypothetical protein
MAGKVILENGLGQDSIKSSVFFDSGLTPGGVFKNVPQYITYTPTEAEQEKVTYTLKKIKDSLKNQLTEEYTSEFDDVTIEKFLYELTTLLVDYRDMRNYIFFGSANTEIAYNIKNIIENYPYKTLIADTSLNISLIEVFNDTIKNETSFLFTDGAIKDIGNFQVNDDLKDIDWTNYRVLDNNGIEYQVKKVIAPYDGSGVFSISNIINGSTSIRVTTTANHGYLVGQVIDIQEVLGTVIIGTDIEINDKVFVTTNVTSNTFEILEAVTLKPLTLNFTYTSGGIVRKSPTINNGRPYSYKIVVEGIYTPDQFINYTDSLDVSYTGFVLSPSKTILSDYEFNLGPIANMLLAPSPINPTPWPRRIVTNNIQNTINDTNPELTDIDFVQWLQDENLLYVKDGSSTDEDIAFANTFMEYRLIKAAGLDETYSNQLVRRAIPADVLSEINDTEDSYFQRFILIAGWLFDQMYVYIKFLKYVHHLNYTEFNQLSPEYYKLYAEHYGFDLFTDDSIDFSKLVIQTEPGLAYLLNGGVDVNNKYYRFTLKQIQEERQKRLLLSLFYLYKTKGTHGTIQKIVSLLGAPEGLLVFNEFAYHLTTSDAFDTFTKAKSGVKVINNEKISVPTYHFEIDPDYLINKTNITAAVNQPYVYKMRLHNESQINLREVSIKTDPNEAIDKQILNFFGKQKYSYVKFNNGEFANTQNESADYFALPLSFPDKYFGNTVTYMIPRGGYVKGVAQNLEETNVHLCSMYLIDSAKYKASATVTNVVLSNGNTTATITTLLNHPYGVVDSIVVTGINGIGNINGIEFPVFDAPNKKTIVIHGVFSGTYSNGGIMTVPNPLPLTKGFRYGYPMPENFSNYSVQPYLSIDNNPTTDFNLLQTKFPSVLTYTDQAPYVIVRLEGNDLVIRLRMDSENNGTNYCERVTICENVFTDDGLNHTLRLIYRAKYVEVYQDYKLIGLCSWKDPITNSLAIMYTAFDIPKKDIKNCTDTVIDVKNFCAPETNTGNDRIRWWDMFIGLPVNIDIYFNKVEVFENNAIDSFNVKDQIFNNNNYNSDTYSFEFGNTTADNTNKTSTDCTFNKALPNVSLSDYNYLLTIKTNTKNITVVKNLTLSSKSVKSNGTKFYDSIQQNFFTSQDVFQDFAWQKNLHETDTYKNFSGKLLDVYKLYSTQILTYNSLLSFLDLIENKFRGTIQQFLPVVVNIFEFGRNIKNSSFNVDKFQYIRAFSECPVSNGTTTSYITSKIFDKNQSNITSGLAIENNVTFSIELPASAGYILTATTVPWDPNKQNVLAAMAGVINAAATYPNVSASIVGDNFRIELDYKWIQDNYACDGNGVIFHFSDGTHNRSITFKGGALQTQFTCATLIKSIPKNVVLNPVYLYYDLEHQTDIVVYDDIEGISDDLIFIN